MRLNVRKRLALLVSKGYFPEELPPCFTTAGLFDIINARNFNVSTLAPLTLSGKDAAAKILPFSIPKVKNHRRVLGIPGPAHYVQLAYCIIQHESELEAIQNDSLFSIFKSHQDESDKRYIGKPDFKAVVEERIIRSSGYRYLLAVDINRFYPSVYTHSIPWAIHSKEVAKAILVQACMVISWISYAGIARIARQWVYRLGQTQAGSFPRLYCVQLIRC